MATTYQTIVTVTETGEQAEVLTIQVPASRTETWVKAHITARVRMNRRDLRTADLVAEAWIVPS